MEQKNTHNLLLHPFQRQLRKHISQCDHYRRTHEHDLHQERQTKISIILQCLHSSLYRDFVVSHMSGDDDEEDMPPYRAQKAWQWDLHFRYASFQRQQFFDRMETLVESLETSWMPLTTILNEKGGYALFDRDKKYENVFDLVGDRLSHGVLRQAGLALARRDRNMEMILSLETVFEDLLTFLVNLVNPLVQVQLNREGVLDDVGDEEYMMSMLQMIQRQKALEILVQETKRMSNITTILTPQDTYTQSIEILFSGMSEFERRMAQMDDNMVRHIRQTICYLLLCLLSDFSTRDFVRQSETLSARWTVMEEGEEGEEDDNEGLKHKTELAHLLLRLKGARSSSRSTNRLIRQYAKRYPSS